MPWQTQREMAALLGLAAILVLVGGLEFPLDFDEGYHWTTIRHAVDAGLRIDLRSTETATSPLFHVLAALEQTLFGGGLPAVRLLVVFFGLAAMILLHAAAARALVPAPLTFTILLFLHPEFFRYSKLVMTEIPSFFWVAVALALLAGRTRSRVRTATTAVALAAAVWTRQSWIFLVGAVGLAGLVMIRRGEADRGRHALAAAAAALALVLPLFALWGGVTPPRSYATPHDPGFHAGQIVFGLALSGFYLGVVGIAGPWRQRHAIAAALGVLAALLIPAPFLDSWRDGGNLANPQGPILKLAAIAADRVSPRVVWLGVVGMCGLGALALARMAETTKGITPGGFAWIYLALFVLQVSIIPQVMERYWAPAVPALILLAHLAARHERASRWAPRALGTQLALLGVLYFLYQEAT